MRQQRQQLVGLAALRDENRDVVAPDDPEIAVHAVHRVKEGRRRAGRCERRGDLATDRARTFPRPRRSPVRSTRRSARTARANSSPRSRLDFGQRVALESDHASPALDRSRRGVTYGTTSASSANGRDVPIQATSHSPRALSKSLNELADGALAAVPVRLDARRLARTSGTAFADGDGKPDECAARRCPGKSSPTKAASASADAAPFRECS